MHALNVVQLGCEENTRATIARNNVANVVVTADKAGDFEKAMVVKSEYDARDNLSHELKDLVLLHSHDKGSHPNITCIARISQREDEVKILKWKSAPTISHAGRYARQIDA